MENVLNGDPLPFTGSLAFAPAHIVLSVNEAGTKVRSLTALYLKKKNKLERLLALPSSEIRSLKIGHVLVNSEKTLKTRESDIIQLRDAFQKNISEYQTKQQTILVKVQQLELETIILELKSIYPSLVSDILQQTTIMLKAIHGNKFTIDIEKLLQETSSNGVAIISSLEDVSILSQWFCHLKTRFESFVNTINSELLLFEANKAAIKQKKQSMKDAAHDMEVNLNTDQKVSMLLQERLRQELPKLEKRITNILLSKNGNAGKKVATSSYQQKNSQKNEKMSNRMMKKNINKTSENRKSRSTSRRTSRSNTSKTRQYPYSKASSNVNGPRDASNKESPNASIGIKSRNISAKRTKNDSQKIQRKKSRSK
jgi:hypothetical protein